MERKDANNKIIVTSIVLIVVILTFLLLSIFCIYRYVTLSEDTYIIYNETSNIDYKVYLKDNNFYDKEYVEKDNQYIASLINYIDTDFNYNLSFPYNMSNFVYSYTLIGKIEVTQKSNKNNIYRHSDTLYESDVIKNSNSVKINESINIDYNKYNDLIKRFISMYDLDDIDSNLIINLYVNVEDENGNTITSKQSPVATLEIPLTTKTIAINMNSITNDTSNNQLLVKNEGNYISLLVTGIVTFIVAIIYIIILISNVLKSRSPLTIYRNGIKKLLSNYSSDIQVINNKYKIGTSQVIKINSFDDMLEIKDTTNSPLLMLENKEKTGSFFIIQTNMNVIYTYAYRIEDIIAKRENRDATDYDIKEISNEIKESKKKEKKYTKEFIEKQLTETISMGRVNGNNLIIGNKEKEGDIYNQLEMTTEFKALSSDEIKKYKKKISKKAEKKEEKKSKNNNSKKTKK